jgi:hypothetical protein
MVVGTTRENSEVFPAASVAVAVINCSVPENGKTGLKAALQVLSVVTLTDAR